MPSAWLGRDIYWMDEDVAEGNDLVNKHTDHKLGWLREACLHMALLTLEPEGYRLCGCILTQSLHAVG